jgi:hypothetical protein
MANVIDKWNTDNGVVRAASERGIERADTAKLAHHLSTVAVRQWEKTLTGMVALPTAAALSVAATATYGVALLERGFEVFEAAIGEIGRTLGPDQNGHERRERGENRAPEARAE